MEVYSRLKASQKFTDPVSTVTQKPVAFISLIVTRIPVHDKAYTILQTRSMHNMGCDLAIKCSFYSIKSRLMLQASFKHHRQTVFKLARSGFLMIKS